MFSRELIEQAVMTQLEQKDVESGICPRCQKGSLDKKHSCEHFEAMQCSQCQHVYVVNQAAT
jgi:rubredoxin